MTLPDSESVLCDVVKKWMKERKIEKYEFDIDGGTSKTDGFIGVVIFFHVRHNGKEDHFVLKTAKTNNNIRETLDADTIYNREICMYTSVIPTLETFTKSKNLTVIPTFIPKMLYNYKESLIMENLRTQNFLMWDRKKPMTLSHMELLFQKYGIWHGITMAFKDQHPQKFSECVSGWKDSRFTINEKFGLTNHFSKELAEVMKRLADRNRRDLVEVYKKVVDKIEDVVYRKDLKEDDMLIISHGDTWCNNFLFKYEDNNEASKPNQVYFLDFQLSRPESPATEISSVLYNMGDKESFENSDNLLKIYHQKLAETLKTLGSNPDNLFTMDDLRRHWSKYALFSVLHTFIYTRVAQCDSEEAPDLGQMAENDEDFEGVFAFKLKDMNAFWDRILEVFIHYGEILKMSGN